MATKGPSRGRIIISSGILTTMLMGLVGWAATEIREGLGKIPVIETKVEHHEKNIDRMARQIDEIHYIMIRKTDGD